MKKIIGILALSAVLASSAAHADNGRGWGHERGGWYGHSRDNPYIVLAPSIIYAPPSAYYVPAPIYYPPVVTYYAQPPVYYSQSPVYEEPGISVIIPLNIR